MDYIAEKSSFLRYLYQNCHCVNAGQSPEQRRAKYNLCRLLGSTPARARRLRDMRPNSIARALGYQDFVSMMDYLNSLNRKRVAVEARREARKLANKNGRAIRGK